MTRRVLILGAGVCGLAAALRIRRNDPQAHIVIAEREDRVGGLARSLTVNGLVADMGPHRIHTELPDVADFLRELAGPEMVEVKRRSRMWLDGRWIEYPPRPLEMIRVWGVPRLAGAGFSWAWGKVRDSLSREQKTDSFESVMTGAFGRRLYELIVLRYTRKVWKIPPSEIHGDIARVRVSAGGLDRLLRRVFIAEKSGEETALKQFFYVPGGVETLAKRMEERLGDDRTEIRTNTSVRGLLPPVTDGGRWQVRFNQNGEEVTEDADLVISTIPVTELAEMLLPYRRDTEVAAAKKEMRFISNFLVCVEVKRERVTDCQWLYFPGRDTIFNRGYEPANFSAAMGAKGRSLIVLEITCHEGDRIWNADDERLVRLTLKGLERTGLVAPEEVGETMVHRIPQTYPLYDLEYRRRTGVMWNWLENFPRLISAGRQGLFLHNNMDHSIHMGFRAAEVATRENPNEPERHFYREVRRFQKFRIVD